MIELLKIVLSLSLSGTLLIFILFLCKPFFRNKLSRQWQYYIWLIVIARLLLPVTPAVSLVGSLFQGVQQAIVHIGAEGQEKPDSPLSPPTNLTELIAPQDSQGGTINGEHAEVKMPSLLRMFEFEAQNGWLICGFVWIMVTVGLLIRKITIYQSFVKYCKAGCAEVTEMRLWEHLGKLLEQAGIRTTVGLSTNKLISSPLLIGFFKPCILLPSGDLSDSDYHNTILHELTHYKRGDMFYKWLVQVTVCLHWFNPLVHLMGREINRACEFSCDETVIRMFDQAEQRAYGNTLLNAIGNGGNYSDSLASVTLNENTELLKERLDAIMNFREKKKMILTVTLILTLVFAAGATAAGAYAAPADMVEDQMLSTSQYKTVKEKIGHNNTAADTVSNNTKTETSHSQEYAELGIEKTDGAYYYNGQRLRIFIDLRADNSFEYFHYDNLGVTDIRLIRNSGGSAVKTESIPPSEAREIVDDVTADSSSAPSRPTADSLLDSSDTDEKTAEDITRLKLEEAPEDIQEIIASCNNKDWYLIEGNGRQYIYYNNLPHNYAYQYDPDTRNVIVLDINLKLAAATGQYVLLSIPQSSQLTISYNSDPVTYLKESSE